jgi:hypothetical protein
MLAESYRKLSLAALIGDEIDGVMFSSPFEESPESVLVDPDPSAVRAATLPPGGVLPPPLPPHSASAVARGLRSPLPVQEATPHQALLRPETVESAAIARSMLIVPPPPPAASGINEPPPALPSPVLASPALREPSRAGNIQIVMDAPPSERNVLIVAALIAVVLFFIILAFPK